MESFLSSIIPFFLISFCACTCAQDKIEKNEFMGEYTGEVLTHLEADARGKVYDRNDRSFLFDINDEVRGEGRKGGKEEAPLCLIFPPCVGCIIVSWVFV